MTKSKTRKIIVLSGWMILVASLVGIPSIFLMVQNDYQELFGSLPSLEQLEKPDPVLSSELISADGVSLGKYYRKNRTQVTYDELSPELVNTLLVTEDHRFKEHSGIDLKSLIRAIIGKLTFQFKGGGSTITMQLAENLYKTNTSNQGSLHDFPGLGPIITKLKEWIISVQLERSYTKEEILVMYLNTVEYGSNSYGIKVAAQTFFNKLPSQLNYSEAAVLIGVINAPTRYSPVSNPENSHAKRAEVLYNLLKYDVISRALFDSLRSEPIKLSYRVASHNQGPAQYFRSVARNFLLNWTKANGYDLFEDGLRIYTTIDSRLQEYAEKAVAEQMDTLQGVFNNHWKDGNPWIDEDGKEIPFYLENEIKKTPRYKNLVKQFGENSDSIDAIINKPYEMKVFTMAGEVDTLLSPWDSLAHYKKFLHAGFMAMEPQTGHIKAWVGGVNYKYFQFDHVEQGRRQPGSTFKPFLYTAAIDNGYSPCFPVVDAAVTYQYPGQDPPTWTPQNASGKFTGNTMTLRQAMAKSVNTASAFIMSKIGPRMVVDYARRMGIKSRLTAVPPLALGAGGEVNVKEMVGAYSTFVNKGIHTQPVYISRIEDQNGNIIQEFFPETKEALNEETAYLMVHMLKGTAEEPGGPGWLLDAKIRSNNEIGAKTGTTQSASDGWFIGITKNLVAGGWVGGEDNSIRFREWYLGQGARTAMPIWEKFMLSVYSDPSLPYEKGKFDRPVVPVGVELDCEIYDGGSTQESEFDTIDEEDIF